MLSVIANQPIDVPTRETLMFLTSRIPLGAEILEVGCAPWTAMEINGARQGI